MYSWPDQETIWRREREQRERAEHNAVEDRKAAAKRDALQTALEASAFAVQQPEHDWEKLGALRPQRLNDRERSWQIHHLIDLAFESDPPTAITWLQHGRRSSALVGEDNAVSLTDRRAVATHAIETIHDVCKVTHEIGHQRTPDVVGRLERELAAWEYALQRALYWTWSQHAYMSRALMSYVDSTKKVGNVLGVVAVEKLVSPDTFKKHERPRRESDIDSFEDRLFFRQHGFKPCASGKYCTTRDAWATTIDAGQLVCRACAGEQQVSRQLRAQRFWRERRR